MAAHIIPNPPTPLSHQARSYPLMFIPTPKSFTSSCSNNYVQILRPTSVRSQPCLEVSKPVTFESSVERYSGSVLGRDTKSRVIVNQTYVGQNGIGKEFGNVWSSPIMNMTRSDVEIVREEADKVMALHMQSPPVFGKSDFRSTIRSFATSPETTAQFIKQSDNHNPAQHVKTVIEYTQMNNAFAKTPSSPIGRALVLIVILFLIYIIIK